MKIATLICCVVISITQIDSAPNYDFKQIFQTPRRDFDKFEILERSNFDSDDNNDQVGETPKSSYANAQISLRFGGENEQKKCGCGEHCQCRQYHPNYYPIPIYCSPFHYIPPPCCCPHFYQHNQLPPIHHYNPYFHLPQPNQPLKVLEIDQHLEIPQNHKAEQISLVQKEEKNDIDRKEEGFPLPHDWRNNPKILEPKEIDKKKDAPKEEQGFPPPRDWRNHPKILTQNEEGEKKKSETAPKKDQGFPPPRDWKKEPKLLTPIVDGEEVLKGEKPCDGENQPKVLTAIDNTKIEKKKGETAWKNKPKVIKKIVDEEDEEEENRYVWKEEEIFPPPADWRKEAKFLTNIVDESEVAERGSKSYKKEEPIYRPPVRGYKPRTLTPIDDDEEIEEGNGGYVLKEEQRFPPPPDWRKEANFLTNIVDEREVAERGSQIYKKEEPIYRPPVRGYKPRTLTPIDDDEEIEKRKGGYVLKENHLYPPRPDWRKKAKILKKTIDNEEIEEESETAWKEEQRFSPPNKLKITPPDKLRKPKTSDQIAENLQQLHPVDEIFEEISSVELLSDIAKKITGSPSRHSNIQFVPLDIPEKKTPNRNEQQLDGALVPYVCFRYDQKPKMLVSYPVFNKPSSLVAAPSRYVEGYSVSSGSGSYSDPRRTVTYKNPTVYEVVRGGDFGRKPQNVYVPPRPCHDMNCVCNCCTRYDKELNE